MLSCHFLLGMGLTLCCQSLSSSGGTHLLTGEISSTFYHAGESGSELKSE
jgi:hypothetical protein